MDSPENIYLQDGSLVIKPVEIKNADGTVSYTSGRVNTQNKHDFKYGLFEARVKVPEGQGFLPAFWMMPTDENLYGQWPRCGEIDIMEVLGNDTTKSYGTVHYGNPHSEQQGSYVLPSGSFSSEYHNFAVEWEPGRINWYVDGNLIHTANDWYSATEGQGEITYPAPFDQPFYIILNLAVGGNWPGSPDETTTLPRRPCTSITSASIRRTATMRMWSVPRRWWSCAIPTPTGTTSSTATSPRPRIWRTSLAGSS